MKNEEFVLLTGQTALSSEDFKTLYFNTLYIITTFQEYNPKKIQLFRNETLKICNFLGMISKKNITFQELNTQNM